MNERAVSETLGYVLVFALVTTTVGVVYATGFSGLDDARQAEQLTNMERAFDVFADNLEDIYRREAPSRATEIKLAGGAVGASGPVTVEVNVTDTQNVSNNASFAMSTKPFIYRNEDTEIVYSAGAVFRSDRGRSTMLLEPGWVIDQEATVIPYVVTYPASANRSLGGQTTVLVVAQRQAHTVRGPFEANTGTGRVNVTVTSPRAQAWQSYFEAEGLTPVDSDATDGSVTYQFFSDVVYIAQTGIEITVER